MADQVATGLFSPYLCRQRIRASRPYIQGRVLDLGCGSGALARFVPADCYLGVDVDEASLTKARRRYPNHRFQSFLPPAEPAFDTVVCLAVIEHVADPGGFLRGASLRLTESPGASMVCTTPHPSFGWLHTAGSSIGLFSRYASEEHEQLLDRGKLAALAQKCGLRLAVYRRFLWSANQLAVFQWEGSPE